MVGSDGFEHLSIEGHRSDEPSFDVDHALRYQCPKRLWRSRKRVRWPVAPG